jgi:Family of unknown function (DUF5681)
MSSVDSPPLAPAEVSATAPFQAPLGTAEVETAVAASAAPEASPLEIAPSAVVPISAAPEFPLVPLAENAQHTPQRGRPFGPGQSGNPNGRPKGSRNRVTRAVEALIDGQGEALGTKALEKALAGDPTMLRALLGTLLPTRRERTVEFELPKIESAADAIRASSAVISACAAGELSPREASEIMGLISTHVRTLESAEFETRLAALEKKDAPSEKKVGLERWQELNAKRSTRGILIHAEENECYDLELQPGGEGDKIRAELRRQNEAHEAHLTKTRGAIK